MHSIFALALFGAVASASSDIGMNKGANGEDFMDFIAQNNKQYEDRAAFGLAKTQWLKSTKAIKELRKSNPQASWGLTPLSDLTDEQMKNYTGLDTSSESSRRQLEDIEYFSAEPRELQTLGAIDWRGNGSLSPVKAQGSCGSCWVFNASVVLETAISLRDSAAAGELRPPVRVSEQEGVDCTYSVTRDGCDGGWPMDYWRMTQSRGGAQFNSIYEYNATSGACRFQENKTEKNPRPVSMGRIEYSLSNVHAKLSEQPISVAVAAGNDVWRNYKGGVVTAAAGCPTRIDHVVVVVAFTPGQEVTIPAKPGSCRPKEKNEKKWCRYGGSDNGQGECCEAAEPERQEQQGAIWTIQNSWGVWGDAGSGFMQLEAIDGLGVCGFNQYIDYITV